MRISLAHPIDHSALNYAQVPIYGFQTSHGSPDGQLADGLVAYGGTLESPEIDVDTYRRNFAIIHDAADGTKDPLILTDPVTGTSLSAYVLNPDALDGGAAPTVMIPSWLSSPVSNSGNQNFYSALAAADPERPYVIMDPPGLGNSDVLPDNVLQELQETGSFIQPGMVIARALETYGLIPDRLAGNSSGGRYMAGLAPALPANTLERLDVCDPPYESVGSIAVAFFVKEPVHRTRGRSSSTDPYRIVPEEGAVDNFSLQGLVKHLGKQGVRQKIAEGKAFGKGEDAFGVDLQAALEVHDDLQMTVICPEQSEVSPRHKKIRGVLSRLSVRDGQSARQLIIPNTTHAFDDHHPLVLIAAFNN